MAQIAGRGGEPWRAIGGRQRRLRRSSAPCAIRSSAQTKASSTAVVRQPSGARQPSRSCLIPPRFSTIRRGEGSSWRGVVAVTCSEHEVVQRAGAQPLAAVFIGGLRDGRFRFRRGALRLAAFAGRLAAVLLLVWLACFSLLWWSPWRCRYGRLSSGRRPKASGNKGNRGQSPHTWPRSGSFCLIGSGFWVSV